MMKLTSIWLTLVSLCLVISANTAFSTLDIGHQVLREKGFQVAATVHDVTGQYAFNQSRWLESNFTTVDWGQARSGITLTEDKQILWRLQGNNVNELTPSPDIVPGEDGPYQYRFCYEIGHEPDFTVNFSPSVVDTAVLNDLAAKYAATRAVYPDVPVTTVIMGGPGYNQDYADSAIEAFVNTVQPDMLIYDDYPFYNGTPPAPHDTHHFPRLAQFRQIALANGIPYGTYLQTFIGVDDLRVPSESDARFDQFTSLVYGYKTLDSFVYDGWGSSTPLQPVLFSDLRGTAHPTSLFYQVAQSNQEIRNIGSSLVYLQSYDVRFATLGTVPSRNTAWQAGASDPYITNISVTSANPAEVIVGYFHPMLEEDDGPNYSNQIYFMVTNCKHGYNLNAIDAQQTIQINFNFASSGIQNLQRLNRQTGLIELISTAEQCDDLTYVQTGANTYRLTLTLPGGTGDLFKFSTGAFFVNGMQCGQLSEKIAGDINNDCYVDLKDFAEFAKVWLLCNDPEGLNCTIDCSDPANEEYCK
ncbi:MAG: hypothetical protein A2Y12_17170 [Planctomycetes bacterium GWF2_42_9]|nr:MAG: hypothetical protein A2Y12_17170 [Planctomycetes bacterium GWF2_42_9]